MGLELKPKKFSMLQCRVAFLGLIIDEQGVCTDPEKAQNILEWAVPASVTDVCSFVGITSYYRRYI